MSDFMPDYAGQRDLFDPDGFAETVTVIGVGSIGSSVLPLLVAMGIRNFLIYDHDSYEPGNLSVSLLTGPRDAYTRKVEVAKEYLLAHGAESVEIAPRKFEPGDRLTSVVIGCVDNMAARQMIYQEVCNAGVHLYLDGRIGGEHWVVFVVEPNDSEWYEKRWLFDDAEASTQLCAARNIIYVPAGLAAEMCSLLAQFSRGAELPRRIERHYGDDSFLYVPRPKKPAST